ncbi:hypothetical protein ACFLRM_03725 [Acidobacteriota bacterium]
MESSHKTKKLFFKDAMVAVCDILGFKNVLYSQPLEDIVKFGFGYLRKAIYYCLHQKNLPEHEPTFDDFQAQDRVGIAWFSDSILLYSLEDNEDGYRDLIETSAWLINSTITRPDLRFRVGVSHGQVFIDPKNHIYLGRAISEAYELQSRQEWSGGALTVNAGAKIPQHVKDTNFPHPWHLVKYYVPLKATKRNGITILEKGKPVQDKLIIVAYPQLAIDWTRFLHTSFRMDWSEERTEPLPDEAPIDVITKWKNTLKFHNKVCAFCKKKT